MGFRGSVESALRQYATFRGRASRSEYWWFYLFTFLVGIVTGIVDNALGTNVINGLASLALLLPSLAVSVRRLHDSNLAGWWLLAPVACGFLGGILLAVGLVAALADATNTDQKAHMTGAAVAFVIIGFVVLLASAILGIVLMVRSSTPGPNRFGPHPQGLGGNPPYGGPGAPQVDQYGNPVPYGQPYGGQPYGGGQYGGQPYGGGQYGQGQPGPYPGQYGNPADRPD